MVTRTIKSTFPSPIRVLYISINYDDQLDVCPLFPSPIGVLYISMKKLILSTSKVMVSVPYWGSLYFNKKELFNAKASGQFPSPIGVLYISISSVSIVKSSLRLVSVPYWGSLYFNGKEKMITCTIVTVSVPYWGSLYFNG